MYKYHTEPAVVEVLKDQSKRVSDKLREVEASMKGLKFKGNSNLITAIYQNYQPKGLDQEWDKWIKKHTDNTIDKANKWLKKTYSQMKDAMEVLNKYDTSSLSDSQKDDVKDFIQYHKNADEAYKQMIMKPWKNPF